VTDFDWPFKVKVMDFSMTGQTFRLNVDTTFPIDADVEKKFGRELIEQVWADSSLPLYSAAGV